MARLDGMDVLIIGGTTLARRLAGLLDARGVSVVTSLAGRTKSPRQLPGSVRTGGFGGTQGLVDWMTENRPKVVVNGVHSFAATMSDRVAQACAQTGTPMARLQPTSWEDQPDAKDWIWVADHDQAAQAVNDLPDPVLLTIGRQETRHYLPLASRDITHRVIDAPDEPLPDSWTLLCQRGPYSVDAERELMDAPGHRIATLVTKDSGGASLDPKLVIAREITATVVMIRRPATMHVETQCGDADQAAAWVQQQLATMGD